MGPGGEAEITGDEEGELAAWSGWCAMDCSVPWCAPVLGPLGEPGVTVRGMSGGEWLQALRRAGALYGLLPGVLVARRQLVWRLGRARDVDLAGELWVCGGLCMLVRG